MCPKTLLPSSSVVHYGAAEGGLWLKKEKGGRERESFLIKVSGKSPLGARAGGGSGDKKERRKGGGKEKKGK